MESSVTSVLRRPFTFDLFDELGTPPLIGYWIADGLWSVLFDGPLTDAQVFAVWARMESSDDADLARRATLRAVAQVGETGRLLNGFEIVRAYLLGDELPDPIYPEPAPEV